MKKVFSHLSAVMVSGLGAALLSLLLKSHQELLVVYFYLFGLFLHKPLSSKVGELLNKK